MIARFCFLGVSDKQGSMPAFLCIRACSFCWNDFVLFFDQRIQEPFVPFSFSCFSYCKLFIFEHICFCLNYIVCICEAILRYKLPQKNKDETLYTPQTSESDYTNHTENPQSSSLQGINILIENTTHFSNYCLPNLLIYTR